MQLAGYETTRELAEKINRPGMSQGTINRITADKREIKEHEAPWFAEALEVPVSFFLNPEPFAQSTTADEFDQRFARLESLVGELMKRVEAAVDREEQVRQLQAETTAALHQATQEVLRRLASPPAVAQTDSQAR